MTEQSRAEYHVTYERPRTNRILHLLLALVTFGLWIPIWILVSMNNSAEAPTQRSITTVVRGDLSGSPQRLTTSNPDDARRYFMIAGVLSGLLVLGLMVSIAPVLILVVLALGGLAWAGWHFRDELQSAIRMRS